MSSFDRSRFNSLSGLAEALMYLAELFRSMGGQVMTLAKFRELQEIINCLQVACPNHEGVIKARVCWYEQAVMSWELHVIPRVLRGEWHLHDRFPESGVDEPFIAGYDVLGHFLRRSYLKGDFSQLYRRVRSVYEHLSKAECLTPSDRDIWTRRLKNLEEDQLDGRL